MKRTALLLLEVILCIASSNAQNDIEIFGPEAPLDCTLTFDMRQLNKEKSEEPYQDAHMILYAGDSLILDRIIQLKARGIFRKNHCHLPPIKLNLRDSLNKSVGFEGHKSVKMVTHCENNKIYKQNVLKEYLVYRIYNLLTEQSFQVRLMNIKYIDSGRKEPKEYIGYGFLIEDIDRVAERNDAIEIEVGNVSQEMLDRTTMRRVALFQFMVGNTDWSVPGPHNLKFIRSNDFSITTPIPIPYDFDFTGMVNAPYALPDPRFPITSVRQRQFLGMCGTLEEFVEALQEFYDLKDAVYELLLGFEFIDDKTRKDLVEYIDDFYEIIENERQIRTQIMGSCKEWTR